MNLGRLLSRWSHLLVLCAYMLCANGLTDPQPVAAAGKPEPTEAQGRLIYAIWDEDLKGAETFLSQGLNPNFLFHRTPQDAFITPLGESIALRQPKMTALLFQYGANANFGEKDGAGALAIAAWYDDAAMVKELINRGANVDAIDDEGYTPLLSASYQSRDLTVIKLLIASGADVKATSSKRQRTTLMLAASTLHLDAVKFFIDSGVDPCAKDSDGETALDSADTILLNANQKAEVKAREAIIALLEGTCSVN